MRTSGGMSGSNVCRVSKMRIFPFAERQPEPRFGDAQWMHNGIMVTGLCGATRVSDFAGRHWAPGVTPTMAAADPGCSGYSHAQGNALKWLPLRDLKRLAVT